MHSPPASFQSGCAAIRRRLARRRWRRRDKYSWALAGEVLAILHKKNGRRNEFSSHFVVVTEAVTYFFLAAAFFAGAFLAGAFLAAGFLAASFFAGAFFAGAFLIAIDNPPFQSAVAVRRKF